MEPKSPPEAKWKYVGNQTVAILKEGPPDSRIRIHSEPSRMYWFSTTPEMAKKILGDLIDSLAILEHDQTSLLQINQIVRIASHVPLYGGMRGQVFENEVEGERISIRIFPHSEGVVLAFEKKDVIQTSPADFFRR